MGPGVGYSPGQQLAKGLNPRIAKFNRYNERQLVIDEPQTLNFHVRGVFSSTDPDSLIRLLRQRPGVSLHFIFRIVACGGDVV